MGLWIDVACIKSGGQPQNTANVNRAQLRLLTGQLKPDPPIGQLSLFDPVFKKARRPWCTRVQVSEVQS